MLEIISYESQVKFSDTSSWKAAEYKFRVADHNEWRFERTLSDKVSSAPSHPLENENSTDEKCWRNDDDCFQIISPVGSGGNAPPIVSDKSEVKLNQGLGIFQNQDSAEDERIMIYLPLN